MSHRTISYVFELRSAVPVGSVVNIFSAWRFSHSFISFRFIYVWGNSNSERSLFPHPVNIHRGSTNGFFFLWRGSYDFSRWSAEVIICRRPAGNGRITIVNRDQSSYGWSRRADSVHSRTGAVPISRSATLKRTVSVWKRRNRPRSSDVLGSE